MDKNKCPKIRNQKNSLKNVSILTIIEIYGKDTKKIIFIL
jgi:hypothetical protein